MKLLDINSFIHFWSRNKNYIEKRLGKVNLKPAYSHGYLNSSGVFTSVEYESYGCLILKLYENDTYVLRKASGGVFRVATFSEEPVTGSTPNQNFNNTSPTEIIVSTTPNDKYMVMYFWCSEFDEMTLDEMYNTIEIYCNYTATSTSASDGAPIGSGMDYYGKTAPENYLFADGSAISRTEYAELFAVIGTTYGAGDGSTTFNLPDKREAVTIMKGTTYTTLGQSVGENTKTIAKANLPSYNLTVTDPGHTHTYTDYYATSSSKKTWDINKTASSVTSVSNTYTSRTSGSKTTGITVSSGGSGTAFNVMQKTLVCNYIIKVKK